ncbi:hypothetical protein IMZ08_07375 [Bacillus luteolus]|uniref:Uncharacterized protein n=1 Tax=Litchfieldia luteola TaxID=682179 RepID=A0ABR9QHB8_9BACI|nr:hypothetical protein [Cytobacillus luteolus]MBE4907873.1 hypothetical protein [Cytobacillus luteolus]MBP1943969.1 CRISPR/Cas system CMR-associated protein Cmr3 (group 5 of RAMP superfamily) [Cytobacillus luteolus]
MSTHSSNNNTNQDYYVELNGKKLIIKGKVPTIFIGSAIGVAILSLGGAATYVIVKNGETITETLSKKLKNANSFKEAV